MEYSTTPLTRGFMTAALDSLHAQPVNWSEPSSIQHLPAFVVHGHVGIGSVEPSPSTEIYPSWYKPRGISTQNSTMDKVSNKVATDCTPALAKQTVGGDSSADHFSADIFTGIMAAANGNTSANDDVHSCSDTPPSIASLFIDGQDATSGGTVTCTGSCTITTTIAQGTHPLNDEKYSQFPGTVNLVINGQTAQSRGVSDSPSTLTFDYVGSGSVTVAIQVIDSVLYSTTSSSATVNFAPAAPAAPAAPTLHFESAKAKSGTTTVSWSGGSGPFTVKNGSVTLCSAPAGATSCQGPSALAPKNSHVTVSDSNGASDTGEVN